MLDEHSKMASELLLLGTERKVFAFDLSRRSRVTIGRHESNDLQLDSRTVSNYHAEILCESGALTLRDLGSTNGTFLNERRVQSEAIHEGDHLRMGNHHVTVDRAGGEPASEPAPATPSGLLMEPGSHGRLISLRGQSRGATQTVEALDLHDVTLPDLLKRMSTSPESLRVAVRRGTESAHIWTRRHAVVHAAYGRVVGEKALYRLFTWGGGEYRIALADGSGAIPETITLPVDRLVTEGMAQATELPKLVAKFPPLEAPLVLNEDCAVPFSEHSPGEMEVFRLLMRHETIASALEASSLADMRFLMLAESLIDKEVFEMTSELDGEFKGTLLPMSSESAS